MSDFPVEFDGDPGAGRSLLLNARRLGRAEGKRELILLACEDVTETKP